ncbi:MAG TPA: PhoH family protein [Candidatus Kapabacteria bacterium]|nr:PhoH family protein [Candidatus Kapabacteria bacterium]
MEVIERKIKISPSEAPMLFGPADQYLHLIEQRFDARIIARGDTISLQGSQQEVAMLERLFGELAFVISKSGSLSKNDVTNVIDIVSAGKQVAPTIDDLESTVLFTHNQPIRVKTPTQVAYYKAVRKNDIVFAIGPAGTGKTYLAVAMAIAALKNREVSKIILARPAVEAGESLGFLPGDLTQKVDPYLRPLYDAAEEMMTADKLKSYVERNIVEVVPLAYMRGRTLNNAFVILDEAQNATTMQMKMFLTRIGIGSKAVITGDVSQIDLPSRTYSGLVQIQDVLRSIEGIEMVYFQKTDVLRHRLVREIIDAYERFHDEQDNDERK